ncbi:hypothetical protein DRQ25_01545 [Candidatus Fermentibacteria bacterium]|nr:MAG: hypothetical protein DRQ25_01545 [Candidatus Fermentibacteria bacterium]
MKLSVFDCTFWDLWIQKILRNVASMKFQWLLLLYVPIIYGMFTEGLTSGQPWITPTVGLGFLGGGFITLATSRILTRSRVTEEAENFETLDTDK